MDLEYEYTFIYKTIKAYKSFEDYILDRLNSFSSNKNKQQSLTEGYLIEKRYLDFWKKFTNYEELKNEIIYKDYKSAKKIIKKYRMRNKQKKYQQDASQYTFFSPSSFSHNLNMGSQYALIDKNFWKLICYDEGLDEDGGMKYFTDKNKIIFTFGKLGNVIINTNDNIIQNGKKFMLKNETKNNFYKINTNNNDDNLNNTNINNDNDYDDSEMKKLILLYAFEQEMKTKINDLRYKEKNFKEYYLISKEWIQEYKRYYQYNGLSKLINSRNDLQNILNKGYNWAKKNIDYALSKILSKNPKGSFPEQLKDENTFLSEGSQVCINDNYSDITYWKNFELINEELKNLFSNSIMHDYNFTKASSARGLINKGKVILDLSNDANNEGNFAYEIGVIGNKDMIFNDEFIFQYDNEQLKNKHYDSFKNDIYSFQKDNLDFDINLKCDLYNYGKICGTAFKIPPHE